MRDPQPQPLLTGPCRLTNGGSCLASPGYPEPYGGPSECIVTNLTASPLDVLYFDVEPPPSLLGGGRRLQGRDASSPYLNSYDSSPECMCDFLTVNSVRWCGSSGPHGEAPSDGIIRWSAAVPGLCSGAARETHRGWEVCWRPISPSPPPAPTHQSPAVPPASPPALPVPAVTSLSTLRLRMAEAEHSTAPRRIQIAPGTHIRLQGAPLNCSARTELELHGGGSATLDAEGESRILDISEGCHVVIVGLTLVNGYGGTLVHAQPGCRLMANDCADGAAIRVNRGRLTLVSSTIVGCAAYRGGAINAIRSAVVVRNSSILNCTAEQQGGAIRLHETFRSNAFIMSDSTVNGCSAKAGGAVSTYDSTVKITKSSIKGCHADTHSGGMMLGLHVFEESLLSGVVFERNTAARASALRVAGGHVTSDFALSAASINDVAFRSNRASDNSTVVAQVGVAWQCKLGRWMPLIGRFEGDFTNCSRMCMKGAVGTRPDHTSPDCGGPCPAGRFCEEGTVEPKPCPRGTISPTRGQGACVSCPHPLSSGVASTSCSVCVSGFYLHSSGGRLTSAEDCRACPPQAKCSAFNTTLESLGVPAGYWRTSPRTAELYRCYDSDACLGSQADVAHARALSSHATATGAYCAEGHAGPRCELCVDDSEYFSTDKRRCIACPTPWRRFAILGGVALGVAILLATVLSLGPTLVRSNSSAQIINRLTDIQHRVGLQPKAKVLVSFYQVCATLTTVYGVRLHDDFSGWLDFAKVFSLDVLDLTYPSACLGSMQTRLLLTALWPYAAVLALWLGIVAHAFVERALWRRGSLSAENHRNIAGSSTSSICPHELLLSRCSYSTRRLRKTLPKILRRCLSALLFVLYIVLPSVSRSIFEARRCESFAFDDATGERISYLLADLSINCNAGPSWSNGADALDAYFWTFFVLWPIAVPLAFLALLLYSRPSICANRITAAARASSFLWNDYESSFVFWEAIDLWRKILLAAFVLFIDLADGSNKLLRLIVATVVCAFYSAILALVRPYRRADDHALACLANMLLTCCFAGGIVLRLCDEEGVWGDQTCENFFGLDSSYSASTFVVALSCAMLGFFLIAIIGNTALAARRPIIRVAATGHPPVLDLPAELHFHIFMSHVWSTGQDQTHALVRQLQLLLPGVRIWLDVVNLEKISDLEAAVANTAVVISFLSAGYFASKNCRREVYSTLAKKKPVVAVIELDKGKGGEAMNQSRWYAAVMSESRLQMLGASVEEMKAECTLRCVDQAPPGYPAYQGPTEILAKIFAIEPVLWLRQHEFQAPQ